MSTPPTPPDRPEGFDRRGGHLGPGGSPDPRERLDLEDPTGMRALLSSLPDPGPMPPDLVSRITASLESEQRSRQGQATITSLQPRVSRWRRAALVAAAAAVVAVAVPALLTGSGPGDLAALLTRQNSESAAKGAASDSSGGGPAYSQQAPTPTGPTSDRLASGARATTIYASGTAYTSAALPAQLQEFIDQRDTLVRPLATARPEFGPLATPAGLEPCLHDLGVAPDAQVAADLATFDGAPAVVLVVSTDTSQQGYVLSRDCATVPAAPLAGPLHLG